MHSKRINDESFLIELLQKNSKCTPINQGRIRIDIAAPAG